MIEILPQAPERGHAILKLVITCKVAQTKHLHPTNMDNNFSNNVSRMH
jgi:hypothetical protein